MSLSMTLVPVGNVSNLTFLSCHSFIKAFVALVCECIAGKMTSFRNFLCWMSSSLSCGSVVDMGARWSKLLLLPWYSVKGVEPCRLEIRELIPNCIRGRNLSQLGQSPLINFTKSVLADLTCLSAVPFALGFQGVMRLCLMSYSSV